MIVKIFLYELLLAICCIFISHRARFSRVDESRVYQAWLDNMMRDAELCRDRVGKRYLKLVVNDTPRE